MVGRGGTQSKLRARRACDTWSAGPSTSPLGALFNVMAQAHQPGERYWQLIDPYWLTLNASWDRGATAFLSALGAVPPKAQHLYACHWCQSEVVNGGLYQFFYNTTGILAPESVAGFQAVGANELAAIVADSMSYFGPGYPRDRHIRLSALPKSQGDTFAASDAKFYHWMQARHHRWELLADSYATGA